MKSISFRSSMLVFCFASLAANAAVPTGTSGREYAETMLLFSDRDFDVRLGAKSVSRQGSRNEPMFDLLAEIAWSACSGKRRLNSDTLAWLARAIGESKQGRYARLVDDCLAKVTDKASIKHFTLAKTALADSPTSNPFVGGNMDLNKIRDDIIKNRKANPAEPLARPLFDGLKGEQRLDDVYAKLGSPDRISGISVPRGKAGFLYVKIKMSDDQLVFSYPGLGEVRFGFDESTGDWLLVDAKSSSGLYWLAREGRFATLADVITSGDEQDLRQVTKLLMKQRHYVNPTLLDRVADRIHHSQAEPDGDMADTLAHMCKLLGRSRNGKYKPLMREVSEKAAHSTLRKYATLAADALPDSGEGRYVPVKIGN